MKTKALLALACLGAVPATAQVNYAVAGTNAYVASSPNASGDIVIASTYNGYPVTRIEDFAFYYCTSLASVTIPDSVIIIERAAFYNCTGLTTVTIPDSVTTISDSAFSSCTGLTNLLVDVANSVYSSLDGVLFNKAQTTLIQFPAGRGGNYVIPGSVTTVGYSAFVSCTNLTGVTIPNSVTTVAGSAFYNCTRLTSVTIPNSVAAIGDFSFSSCSSLTNVTVPNSVTTIGNSAFSYCTRLARVTIGNGVTNIGGSAFNYCIGLTNFSVDAANSVYSSLNGVLFNEAQTTLIQFPTGRGGNYVVPNSVSSIGDAAFLYCSGLTNVTIPNSVTNIGFEAFYNCTRLTRMTIGNSVTTIGSSAFSSCTGLTNVTIPSSVTSIGRQAFSYCIRLASVTIPNSVTNIGDGVFNNCANLMNLTVDTANSVYSSLNGVLLNKAQTTLIRFPAGRSGDYVIPGSITTIDDYAFYFCTYLTSVTIGNNVTTIGDWTFAFCSYLTNVTIGNSVTTMGDAGFRGCTNLTNVTIPASVTNIGRLAFSYCTSLTNFTFLGNAPFLADDDAFDNVGASATVYYYYGTTGWGPLYGGLPTVMLGAPAQIGPGTAGVKPGGFGFTITGVVNQTVVVEASTNLATWQLVWTNTLSGVSTNFVDPQSPNHPRRFYRTRSN